MGKYFGTDGIRGKANEGLTIEIATKVGEYLGYHFRGNKIIVGQDTRLSSSMFASAIAAGATSMGADVYLLGVCATPALAYMIPSQGFKAGVMISASHNPFHDNGLKCFAETGMKLDESLENHIERYIDGEYELEAAHNEAIGVVINYDSGLEKYLNYLESKIDVRFENMKIVLDTAHGSAVSSAERVFRSLGADVIVLNDQPTGININEHCGSTHPDIIMAAVKEFDADLGFAFDGDADRCLAVNHQGKLVDGDEILYILGNYFKNEGRLTSNTIVSTVMANLGFLKSCERSGLNVICTDVGDKHVFAEMFTNHFDLGGEQSGHIILKDYATTGDGVLTALALTEVMVKQKQSLYELGKGCERFPQLLENLTVEDKDKILKHPLVTQKYEEIVSSLGDDGRILVRASGTEPLVRVMVEAKTHDLCKHYVSDMIKVIKTIE